MLNVSIEELEAYIPELEAGNSLTLVREGKPFAEVVPIPAAMQKRDRTQRADVDELMQILEKGYDLGGLTIADRDALYESHE